MWQGDLETDVPCQWRGADEEMASPRAHSVYVSMTTEGDGGTERETERLSGRVGRKRGGAAVGEGEGRRRRWQWRVVKREINQVKAICGNGCCSVIRNPVTQQLL